MFNNHRVGANLKLQPMFLGPYDVVKVNDTNVRFKVGKKTHIAYFNRVKTVKESIEAGLEAIAEESLLEDAEQDTGNAIHSDAPISAQQLGAGRIKREAHARITEQDWRRAYRHSTST